VECSLATMLAKPSLSQAFWTSGTITVPGATNKQH